MSTLAGTRLAARPDDPMKHAGSATKLLVLALLAGCTAAPPPEGQGSSRSKVSLNTEATEGTYFLTTFGGPDDSGDNGQLACGGTSDPRSSDVHQKYYAAAKQRFGCGTHIKLEAAGNCIVLETTDAGPAAWVEDKAGGPVIDATPLAAQALFGAASFGWSDRQAVQLSVVDASVPLGPCTAGAATPTTDTAPSGAADEAAPSDDSASSPAPNGSAPSQPTPPPGFVCDAGVAPVDGGFNACDFFR